MNEEELVDAYASFALLEREGVLARLERDAGLADAPVPPAVGAVFTQDFVFVRVALQAGADTTESARIIR